MAQSVSPPIIVNSGSNPLKTVLGVGLLVGFGFAAWEVKKYLSKVADQQALKKEQQSTISVSPGKKLFDLMGRPIKSANLGTIATDLYDSLSFPTDNKRVVRVFRTTPYGYVPALEKYYLDKYGENLKETMVKKMKDEDWISIKYNFR